MADFASSRTSDVMPETEMPNSPLRPNPATKKHGAEEATTKTNGWRTIAIAASVLVIVLLICNLVVTTVAFVVLHEMQIEGGSSPLLTSTANGRPVGTHAVRDVYSSATTIEHGNLTISHLHGQLQTQVASVACSEVLAGIRKLEDGYENEFSVKCHAPGCAHEVSVMAVSSSRFAPVKLSELRLDEEAGWFGVIAMAVANDPDAVGLRYDSECHMTVASCRANPSAECSVRAYAPTAEETRRRLAETHGAHSAALDALFLAVDEPAKLHAAISQFNADHFEEARRRQLYHSRYCPAISGAGCHPAGSLLQLEGGRRVPIERAAVGMRIATPSGYERITGVFHAEDRPDRFVRLSTADGHMMAITPLHLVFANGAEADPAAVRVGDELHTAGGGVSRVTRVERVKLDGKYHIFVAGGSYYVDGVLASDRLDLVPAPLWPLVRAYVAARDVLGVPIMPVGTGLFPNHAWLLDLLTRIGTPQPLLKFALFPLTVVSGIGTELVNTAAERLRVPLGTAAALALALALPKMAPLRASAAA